MRLISKKVILYLSLLLISCSNLFSSTLQILDKKGSQPNWVTKAYTIEEHEKEKVILFVAYGEGKHIISAKELVFLGMRHEVVRVIQFFSAKQLSQVWKMMKFKDKMLNEFLSKRIKSITSRKIDRYIKIKKVNSWWRKIVETKKQIQIKFEYYILYALKYEDYIFLRDEAIFLQPKTLRKLGRKKRRRYKRLKKILEKLDKKNLKKVK